MTPGNYKVEFVGGPLDGEGEMGPLSNIACCRNPDWPEGWYYTGLQWMNPQLEWDGRMYWVCDLKQE